METGRYQCFICYHFFPMDVNTNKNEAGFLIIYARGLIYAFRKRKTCLFFEESKFRKQIQQHGSRCQSMFSVIIVIRIGIRRRKFEFRKRPFQRWTA